MFRSVLPPALPRHPQGDSGEGGAEPAHAFQGALRGGAALDDFFDPPVPVSLSYTVHE